MNKRVIVHKLDHEGNETWRYEGQIVESDAGRVLLKAHFDRDDVEFFGVLLRRGDTFIEAFYNDRWYNVFSIFDVDDGHHKGWYVNLTRPAKFEDGHIYADDLALDLVIDPEGKIQVVDQDEFDAQDLPSSEREQVWAAVNEIEALVYQGLEPFQSNPKLSD
jgi:predicted RNA-binding protein associated with RNAse of E/G family